MRFQTITLFILGALALQQNDPRPYRTVTLGTHAPKTSTQVWKLLIRGVGHATAFPIRTTQTHHVFLTAKHVTDVIQAKGKTAVIESMDRRRKLKIAKVDAHPTEDIALVYTLKDAKPVEALKLSPSIALTPGLSVFSSGYAHPMEMWWVHRGYLAEPRRCSTPVRQGMSGGPLLLNDGTVLGVISQMANFRERVFTRLPGGEIHTYFMRDTKFSEQCLYVPIRDVKDWLEKKGALTLVK